MGIENENEIDFTMMCSCGWERYAEKLRDAKTTSREHARMCSKHEVIINRNVDKEIDGTFQEIMITRDGKKILETKC